MKMKIVFCVVFLMVLSASCTLEESNTGYKTQDTNTILADESMNKVLEAIQSENTELLLSLFSENALANAEDTTEQANSLYAYYQGNCLSYDNWGRPNVEVIKEDDQLRKELYTTYDIHTEIGKYRVAFLYIAEDTKNPTNVGIWSMYIINWNDDTDPEIAYRGDDNYLPGIHIGIKNALSTDAP